jgi:hypothetical protein
MIRYLRLVVPQISENLISAKHRLARFEATSPKPSTLQDMLNVLGDTTDSAYPIFRRNDTTHEDTLFSIAFDLDRAEVSVFRDNPRSAQALLWKESIVITS